MNQYKHIWYARGDISEKLVCELNNSFAKKKKRLHKHLYCDNAGAKCLTVHSVSNLSCSPLSQ